MTKTGYVLIRKEWKKRRKFREKSFLFTGSKLFVRPNWCGNTYESWSSYTVFDAQRKILSVAEKLLLENNQEITLDELVAELDIAKGTLYKHFRSKNELLLELIIQNEKQILEISQKYNTDFKEYAPRYMLHHLLTPGKTILLHQLEENLTMTESKLKHLLKSFMKFVNNVF